jgi:hypothetical protein
MSQYPPPGGPPMYPPNVPPGGFGPPGYSLPSQSRTSAVAIVSLICGLVLCFPVITGLIAIITGIIGIGQTSNPAYKGRGMAIAGLLLGVVNCVAWLGGGYAMYAGSGPARAFAHQYINNLSAGNVDQCFADVSSNSTITKDQINAEYQKMQAWGTLQRTMIFGFSFTAANGQSTGAVSGSCAFSNGQQHTFQMILSKQNGQFKVDQFLWQN